MERQRPQHGLERLGVAGHVAREVLAADARHGRPDAIGVVGIQALRNRASGHAQDPTPCGGLEGLEVPPVDRPPALRAPRSLPRPRPRTRA